VNGQQRAVLWIGLILVALNIVSRWAEVRSVIFNGAGLTAGIPGSSSSSSGGNSITVPIDPLLPGVSPKIKIPVPKLL